MDNRPLKFDEFEAKMKSVLAVSATPGPFEIQKSCTPLITSSQPSPLEEKGQEKNNVASFSHKVEEIQG
ncbi:MAG: hypothetical protein Q8S84_02640 [bacterium]|nr:hypothetical protein [bacterium]